MKVRARICQFALLTALGLLGSVNSAQAIILPPGTSGPPDAGGLTGPYVILADTGNKAFSGAGTGTPSGFFREVVVSGDTSNTFGGLDFVYQVAVDSTSDAVTRVTVTNYKPATSVEVSTDPGPDGLPAGSPLFTTGTALIGNPLTVDRSANGSVIGFNFPTPPAAQLIGGDITYLLIVRTDVTTFGGGFISVIDGGTSTNSGFSPVPEPGTICLMAGCVVGLGGYCVRKRRKQKSL